MNPQTKPLKQGTGEIWPCKSPFLLYTHVSALNPEKRKKFLKTNKTWTLLSLE